MIRQRVYNTISRSYATALFNAAQRQGTLQRLLEECRVLREIAGRSPQLRVFFENPRVPTEDKQALVDKVFGGRLSPLLIKLLHLLVQRDRSSLLDEILDLFRELVEQAEGIQHAYVQTARELNFQEKVRLKSSLEKFTGSKLRIDYAVDPSLLGGIVFRYQDTLIDSSLRAGLREIRRRLAGATVLRDEAA